jgi:hypothetical protein
MKWCTRFGSFSSSLKSPLSTYLTGQLKNVAVELKIELVKGYRLDRMMITLVYDGHLRGLFILPYSAFVTNCIAGALELPADLVPLVTLDTIGRRWTCFLALVTSGVSGVITGLIDQGIYTTNDLNGM